MIQTVLFDFDGTLFDTGEGILRSVQYALEGFGIHETDTARLRKFVGPPLLDSFSELYAMTPEQAQAAVARYRERYLPVGIYECTLYPGIPELLERLRAHGFRIAVATGKPTPMARSILQRFDLERLFDCVIGCEYDGTRSTKAEVVVAALAETHTPPEDALMVGDRKYDVTGAAADGRGAVRAPAALERGINPKLPAETMCSRREFFVCYQDTAFPSTRSGSASEISRSA